MTSPKTYIVNDQATEIDALDFTPSSKLWRTLTSQAAYR